MQLLNRHFKLWGIPQNCSTKDSWGIVIGGSNLGPFSTVLPDSVGQWISAQWKSLKKRAPRVNTCFNLTACKNAWHGILSCPNTQISLTLLTHSCRFTPTQRDECGKPNSKPTPIDVYCWVNSNLGWCKLVVMGWFMALGLPHYSRQKVDFPASPSFNQHPQNLDLLKKNNMDSYHISSPSTIIWACLKIWYPLNLLYSWSSMSLYSSCQKQRCSQQPKYEEGK